MSALIANPAPAAPAELQDHSVRFYDRDAPLVEEVADFLDGALRAGGMAVGIATASHRAELSRRLSGIGGPVAGKTTWFTGRLVLLDAAETLELFMVDGVPDAQRFEALIAPLLAQAHPGKPVHAFGEMVALLCERGEYEAAVALEALWNALATRYRFSLFCAYPRRLFASGDHAQAFQHICAAHTHVDLLPEETGRIDALQAGNSYAQLRQHALVLRAEVARRTEAERTLRQRERELADFLDNACEGIHKVAADGTILYANRAELEMLGYTWDDYVGHNIAEFYVDQPLIQGILHRLKHGEVLRDQPALLVCKDGSTKPVRVHSNAYFEDGRLLYTRCFSRDASERLAREQAMDALEQSSREREQLLQSLNEASRAKDEFLAMLGHELRNPLSPIVTALQLMRMRGDTGTAREQAIIQRQVDHMVRLVDDLLDISRITRGKIELKRERVDLSGVLAKAVEQAGVLLERRSHRLQIEVEAGLRCDCDAVRIAQVVANLLTNAARYTEEGGEIRLHARREPGERIAISVRDNGKGIEADMLPRIFELFYQGERSVDRAEGGLGIGLALVRSLVDLHGGSVEARSDGPGQGSEFTVRLPASSAAEEAARAANDEAIGVAAAAGRRILLVDDNEDAAETMGQLLRSQGHQVAVFTNPVAALAALDQLHPEIAVLDIGLPVIDGYELGARIRAVHGACRLVALTGYGQDGDKARSQAAGFACHLVKPVAPAQLLEMVAARD